MTKADMPAQTKLKSKKTKIEKVEEEDFSKAFTAPPPSLWVRLNVRLSFKDKLFFAKYLSILLNAGLPLDHALSILAEQSKGALKTIVETIIKEVQNGRGLANGLAHYPHVFSNIFTNLVRAGETSGTLEQNLNYLADQLQKQYDLSRSIKGAMVYPAVVVFGGLGVSILVIIFVLPNIVGLFQSMNVDLPITTRILIWIADASKNYPLQISLGTASFFTLLFGFSKIPAGRRILDKISLSIPVISHIIKSSNLARAFRLIGTLLQSGTPLEQTLEITATTIQQTQYKQLFIRSLTLVKQGGELSDTFKNYPKLIPPISRHLVNVGSETGTLVGSFLYLADFYEKDVEETSKRISTLMEPILIIMMGAGVTFLAFSIISPIYQVVTTVQ